MGAQGGYTNQTQIYGKYDATTQVQVKVDLDGKVYTADTVSQLQSTKIRSSIFIAANGTAYTSYTAVARLGLKQFYAGGTAAGKQTLYRYVPATTQFVTGGDFESSGDVSQWTYSTSGATGTTVAFSTAQHNTGSGSMGMTFTQSAANADQRMSFVYGTPQDFTAWRYVSAAFYNTVSAGGAYTRTIQIILTDSSGATRTYQVSGLSTSSPFNTAGWINILGDIDLPTSSTGTGFDESQVTSLTLRFFDSANRAGTIYWDTVKLTGQLTTILPIFHDTNQSFNVTLDPVETLEIGDQILLVQQNLSATRSEFFAMTSGVPL